MGSERCGVKRRVCKEVVTCDGGEFSVWEEVAYLCESGDLQGDLKELVWSYSKLILLGPICFASCNKCRANVKEVLGELG